MGELQRNEDDWQIRKCSLSQQNQFLLEKRLWTDCEFVVSNNESHSESFRCHKLLLSKASPVFAAMLLGPLAEDNEVIRVTDIHPRDFALLLQFVYTDVLQLENAEDACGLCYAAHKYMLPRVQDACIQHLNANLCPETACQTYELAKLIETRELADTSFKMIQDRTKEVIKSESFLRIQYTTLFEIVRQNTLMLYSEAHLVRASFCWAAQETAHRGLVVNGKNIRSTLGLALYRLRFLALTTKEFADCVAQTDVLTNEEKLAFFIKLSSPGCENVQIPDGFCPLVEDRMRPSISVPGFMFDTERFTQLLDFEGGHDYQSLHCLLYFTVGSPVLLVGVEVPTQDRPEYAGITYWESVDVTLQDSAYKLKALATFRGSTPYNATQDIKFNCPVVIEPDTKYKVTVAFLSHRGFYRKGNGVSKSTNQNIFLNESKVATSLNASYIRSLIYLKK